MEISQCQPYYRSIHTRPCATLWHTSKLLLLIRQLIGRCVSNFNALRDHKRNLGAEGGGVGTILKLFIKIVNLWLLDLRGTNRQTGVRVGEIDVYIRAGLNQSSASNLTPSYITIQAPCVLYIGQAFRYSPENAFYIFNQQIYFII